MRSLANYAHEVATNFHAFFTACLVVGHPREVAPKSPPSRPMPAATVAVERYVGSEALFSKKRFTVAIMA